MLGATLGSIVVKFATTDIQEGSVAAVLKLQLQGARLRN
jgi:hypothetical protein